MPTAKRVSHAADKLPATVLRPFAPLSAIEIRGIERVPPAERRDASLGGNLTLWLSANTVISTVALGALGRSLFGLGVYDSLLCIVLFTCLGTLPVALFATLGPRLGLRQMTITRFSFGWGGAAFMALLNVIACVGWSAVNVIMGGQLLESLTGGRISCEGAIVVLATITTLVSIYGYAWVHAYERFAWLPMALALGCLAVGAWPEMRAVPPPALDAAEVAAFLSFGGAVYAYATAWAPYAADYNVEQPQDVPARKVFWLTFTGVALPCIVLEALGIGLTTVPALASLSGGRLLAAAAAPLHGLAPLVVAVLASSVIANNIPNDYSLGLSIQVMGRGFARIHRHVWTLIGALVYVALAIPAAAHFSEALTDFLLVIGYWLGPWSTIVALEHLVFRRGRYEVEAWDDPARLPAGWAALVALALGGVGAWLGAAQAWHVGPLARLVGVKGADIGFELAMAISGVAYLVLRPLERRLTPSRNA